MTYASARCDICGSDKIHAHSPYEVELERYIRPQFEEYFKRNITVSGFHSSVFKHKNAYQWGFDWKRRSQDCGVTDYFDQAVEVAWRLWRTGWMHRNHEITKACELACGVPTAPEKGERIPSGEDARLKARDLEAVAIINAAFGEYACMIKAKLSDAEIATFEKNFAVRARAYLAIDRASPPPAKAEDGIDDAMVERANAAYDISITELYVKGLKSSIDLAEIRTTSMRAALRAALVKEETP